MSYRAARPSAVSVEIQSVGIRHLMRRMRPHAHLFFELLLCVQGEGTLVAADREIELRARSVVALAPGVIHDCRKLGAADLWSIIFLSDGVVSIPEAGFAADGRLPNDISFDVFRATALEAPRAIELNKEEFGATLSLVSSMKRELESRRVGYDVMVRNALQMLLVTVGRCAGVGQGQSPEGDRLTRSFLVDVFADIDEHYGEHASLRAAAGRLDVQPGHLTTKLRRITGRTYGMWLKERRMIEARRLLADTNLTLAEIAERLGYAEIESFIRRFRMHHSITPASWRRGARSKTHVAIPSNFG